MNILNSVLHRLYTVLLAPRGIVENQMDRQLSVILSGFQLVMIPFAIFTILTADLVNDPVLLILGASIGILLVYLISRRIEYKKASKLIVVLYTIFPIIIWFSVTSWQSYDLPRIMPYIIVAIAIGALFIGERAVVFQVIILSTVILYTAGIVYGLSIWEYDGFLLTVLSSSFMVMIFARVINAYLVEINKQAFELQQQNNELEIYTRLLRHDLSNDLQVIMNSVELSQLLLPLNEESVHENLEQSFNLTMRMQNLLQLFKLPAQKPNANLIEDIKLIALESEEVHRNLSIEVSFTKESEGKRITASRLLPLVWTNIFRNAAQHAGDHPVVQVKISDIEGFFHIGITDNGPGIPDDIRKNLFKKGEGLTQQDKGVGLYLSKLIIESHGGTIEVSNKPETEFIIRIPTISSN